MGELEIRCDNCDGRIDQYYDRRYGGRRGRCPGCGVEFPLE